jgi:hypothetical protein
MVTLAVDPAGMVTVLGLLTKDGGVSATTSGAIGAGSACSDTDVVAPTVVVTWAGLSTRRGCTTWKALVAVGQPDVGQGGCMTNRMLNAQQARASRRYVPGCRVSVAVANF